MEKLQLQKEVSVLSFVVVVHCSSTEAQPADTGRLSVAGSCKHTQDVHFSLYLIPAAAVTTKPAVWEPYLRIAPDPTPPAGP